MNWLEYLSSEMDERIVRSSRRDRDRCPSCGKRGAIDRTERMVNDVWSSADGRTWIRSAAELPGPPRTADFLVSFRDAVLVFGGKTGGAGGTGFWDGIYLLR